GQRIGLVRVVDEDRRAVVAADEFEPALGAFEMSERGEGGAGLGARADDKPRRDERVLHLERARQRQAAGVFGVAMANSEHLGKASDSGGDEATAVAALTDGDEPQP